MSNPWNLTPALIDAMEAVIEHGSDKLAARAIGVEQNTVCARMSAARQKMGERHRLQAVLAYDRWKRGQE
jgi:predicted DNA-binding protein (UPF0251 family)